MESRNSPIPRRRGRALLYGRHFILLAIVAAALGVTERWHHALGAIATLGFYGALHASVLVAALRVPQAAWRKLAFIALAAGLAMLSLRVGLGLASGAPAALLTLSAGLGAAGYGVLIRGFFMRDLPLRSLIAITLGCAVVTVAALPLGRFLHTLNPWWFAMIWWWSFSLALWYQDDHLTT